MQVKFDDCYNFILNKKFLLTLTVSVWQIRKRYDLNLNHHMDHPIYIAIICNFSISIFFCLFFILNCFWMFFFSYYFCNWQIRKRYDLDLNLQMDHPIPIICNFSISIFFCLFFYFKLILNVFFFSSDFCNWKIFLLLF